MRIIGITFLVMFLITFLCAKIKVNNSSDVTIMQRVFVSIMAAAILTLIIGLPILGIYSLITW